MSNQGSKLIFWPDNGNAWIEGKETWVDLGYVPTRYTSAEFEFCILGTPTCFKSSQHKIDWTTFLIGTPDVVIGHLGTSDSNDWRLMCAGGNSVAEQGWVCDSGNSRLYNFPDSQYMANRWYHATIGPGCKLQIDDRIYDETTFTGSLANSTIKLFSESPTCTSSNPSGYYGWLGFKYVKIFENGVLKMYLVPAKDNGKACFFDKLSGRTYFGLNKDLTYHAKQFVLEDNYTLVDQLIAQDEAYVDTDIMPNPLFAFEMNVKFRANSNVNGPGNVYFGCANDLSASNGQGWENAHNPEAWTGFSNDASYGAIQSFNDRKIRFKLIQHMFWQQNGSTTNPTPDAWHTVKINDYTGGTTPPLCQVDGSNFPLALNSSFSNSDIPRAPICVFAIAEADKRHRCCAYPGTAMRWLKFWNTDNELVHDLRAATSGKRIGLVDLCTRKFYKAFNCEVA